MKANFQIGTILPTIYLVPMKLYWRLFIFLCCFLGVGEVLSQSVSLFTPLLEDLQRRKQLTGEISDEHTFMVRPMMSSEILGLDTLNTHIFVGNEIDEKLKIKYLPVLIRIQHNTKYPFGQNNGVMIPNRGIQTVASGGFHLSYGKFSLQFQPELLISQNRAFRGMPFEEGRNWRDYYEYLNRIDLPERFGSGPIRKPYLGNSSIRFAITNELSVGLSNEYLWWGPSRRNALMMSNNAPGFLHVTVNSQKPIQSIIGTFEGQFLMGRLQNSGFLPPNSTLTERGNYLFVPKRDMDWRYLAGIILSYRPKWIPGFSIGYSSTSQMYHNDMEHFGDYLPIFNGRKRNAHLNDPVILRRHQQSAGFFRWLSSQGKFEFYGEYGTNGNSKTLREFIVNPDLHRAFTLGFVKLISLRQPDQFIQVGGEITQTGQTVRKAITGLNSWYTHSHVRHGFTNRGQNMGYGYGSGSNSAFIEVAWVKEFSRIGFQMERIANNNDSFYLQFEHINGWDRYWIDLVPSVVLEKKIGQLLLSSRFQFVKTLNYYWVLERDPGAILYRLQPGDDRTNFVAHINLGYFLNR